MIEIRSDGFSKPGQAGKNEDTVLNGISRAGRKLFAVADGMGGAPGGGIASTLAINSLESTFMHGPLERFDAGLCFAAVQAALDRAASQDNLLREMGTTLSFCSVDENGLSWGHVGDCRIYLIRDQQVRQLTTDQTVVQDMVDRGEISGEEAERHPRRNLLTSVLRPNRPHRLLSGREDMRSQDRVLILSDGAYDELSSADLHSLAQAKIGATETCSQVLSMVESAEPRDDYSLIVFRIV